MSEIIIAAILWLISVLLFLLSILAYQQKGFLLNNAYLYATRIERDAMEKKPYYRQSCVVFLLLGLVFLLNGVSVLWKLQWIPFAVAALLLSALIYAVASSIAIARKTK